VFVDEAYTEFLDNPKAHTVIPLVKEGYDIIVAKTFSKVYGMAGLRVGFALAQEKRIKQLEKHGVSLSIVSKTSVAAATACLDDADFIAYSRKKNQESKKVTYQVIKEAGYNSAISSYTSFIMFPIDMDGKLFLSKMEKLGVGVRAWNFDNKNWCRVSLGKPEDMLSFGNALKQIS
jgi:histidinol-phosphate aminotransferase